MRHLSATAQVDLPSLPLGDSAVEALPIVVITFIVALLGGATIYALGRKGRCLLRLIAVVVFTFLVAAGLVLSLWIAYDLSRWGL